VRLAWRFRYSKLVGVGAFVLTALLGASARAQEAKDAGARVVNVWYRAAAACPDGGRFIQLVSERTPRARLADIGDRVDFVVTMGSKANASFGRLERQTARGTIAIRELAGESCDQIADALALTLALTLTPGSEPADDPGEATSLPSQPVPDAEPGAKPERDRQPRAASEPTKKRRAETQPSALRVAGGVVGTLVGGVAPAVLRGFGVYVQGALRGHGLFRPSTRLALGFAGSNDDPLDVSIYSGRLDACPLALGTSSILLRSCLNLEIGQISANYGSNDAKDRDIWVSSGALLRLEYYVFDRVLVDVSAGARLPLRAYTFLLETDRTHELHRTAWLTSYAGVGLGLATP